MIRRNPVKILALVLCVIATLNLLLLLSGYRVLIGEERSYHTIVEGSVVLGAVTQGIGYEKISCTYFTGRSVRVSEATSDQIDECPTLTKPF